MKKIFVFILLFCATAFGDQVVLTNGDRITGVIKKFDDQKLFLSTEYSGDITIKWSAINKVIGDQPLHVERADHEVVTGDAIVSYGPELTVQTASAPVTVESNDIKAIRSDSEEQKYEKQLHPKLTQAWLGGGNFGIALARGNSETTNFSLGFNAARKTLEDKLTIYANSVYSTDGATDSTTANDIRGGLRYDRDISRRWFGFVSGDFETDAIQSLNLRSVGGSGVGFHAINSKAESLDLLAGGAYTREDYDTGLSNDLSSADIGVQYSKSLAHGTTITQKAFFLPYLNDLGEYRSTFDLGMATKINKLLTWQVNFNDRYVSNPLIGTRQNDLLLTTGVGVTFGKKE
jgi:hypothetical protein